MRADAAQIQQQVRAAREQFRVFTTDILTKAQKDAESIGAAIGEISVAQAAEAWIHQVLETIEEMLDKGEGS